MSEKEVSPEARKSAIESDYAALYAVAGLTDALADALKGALAETQQKATERINALQSRRPELSKQAKDLRTFVITLPDQFKHLPDTTKARIAELQRQANDLLAQATSAYGDYAVRGKQAVDEARRSTRERSNPNGTPVTSRGAATDIGEPAAESTRTKKDNANKSGAKKTD